MAAPIPLTPAPAASKRNSSQPAVRIRKDPPTGAMTTTGSPDGVSIKKSIQIRTPRPQIRIAGCDHKGRQNRLVDAYLPVARDPCDRSLLCRSEAGGAPRRLPDNRSAQLCLCPCTPEAQESHQGQNTTSKRIPPTAKNRKRTPKSQIRTKRNHKKHLQRPILQDEY